MRPTDIPGLGGLPASGDRHDGNGNADGVDSVDPQIRNDAARAAIDAFNADPGPVGMLDVLRHCLHGHLLLDITGSEITMTDDGQIAEGSTITVRGGEGPDDKPAMYAFTSQEQMAAMYTEEGVQIQSLVQPAVDVLELCRSQDSGWLILDPAGPTCALGADDLDFALRVPRNDAVRAALEPGVPREVLLDALHAPDTALSLAIIADEESGLDPDVSGEVEEATEVRVRTTDAPDGSEAPALAAFTSGPELLARAPEDRIASQSTEDVVALVRDGGFAGLLLNAAGPWVFVTGEELRAYRA